MQQKGHATCSYCCWGCWIPAEAHYYPGHPLVFGGPLPADPVPELAEATVASESDGACVGGTFGALDEAAVVVVAAADSA